MSLKHGLLGLLNYGSMTGYELGNAFKDSLGFFWQAQMSQVYRELNSMEEVGWLTSEWIVQEERPNKRLYTITSDGQRELDNWLATPDKDIEAAMRVRSAFLMRVFFAGEQNPEETLALLREFERACLGALASMDETTTIISHYESMIPDSQRRAKYWKMAATFGKDSFQAQIEWVRKSIIFLEGDDHDRPSD